MDNDIDQVLFGPEDLKKRVQSIALEINEEYEGKELLLVGVLKGCVFFMADLIRRLKISVAVDFLAISKYESSSKKSGNVRLLKDLENSIENRHVLLVEDIVDTGLTLGYLLRTLKDRSPASLRVCALLDRVEYRIVRVPVDYRGFEIGRQFAVGYGLDYQMKYRNLPFIGTLKKDVGPFSHAG